MEKMASPRTGVKIRMYRQGHGDCFLLAFAGSEGQRKKDVYVLIDCGLKPGSEVQDQKIEAIVDDIHEATGGVVDVVVVTHEHQDHVSGFAKTNNGTPIFDKITFKHCWLAWTEDGTDDLANRLRNRFRDTLVALAFAQEKAMAMTGAEDLQMRLSDVLGTEIGEDVADGTLEGKVIVDAFRSMRREEPLASTARVATASVKGIRNKTAMKYLRNKSKNGVTFLDPEAPPALLPHVQSLKVFTLGPPRNEALLLDLDPTSQEEFHLAPAREGLALDSAALGLAATVAPEMCDDATLRPFSKRHEIARDKVFNHTECTVNESAAFNERLAFLRKHYGGADAESSAPEVAWRRIDEDWLGSVDGLALRLNNEVNNTSLVLAFELPKSGKVLLFTGDAQRGSWIGWSDLSWASGDGASTTTARDLLSRCVFYKVGHHGSQNATLNGTEADEYANIGWMARGAFADDFVAMIPANTSWAMNKRNPWLHPLPKIEDALIEKARGRVFRTDLDQIAQPDHELLPQADWEKFQKNIKEEELYFEYSIEDE